MTSLAAMHGFFVLGLVEKRRKLMNYQLFDV